MKSRVFSLLCKNDPLGPRFSEVSISFENDGLKRRLTALPSRYEDPPQTHTVCYLASPTYNHDIEYWCWLQRVASAVRQGEWLYLTRLR